MTEQAGKPFDAKALAECDGTAGKPSCIAVDGVVYDVSASRLWKGGLHMKRHRAGGISRPISLRRRMAGRCSRRSCGPVC